MEIYKTLDFSYSTISTIYNRPKILKKCNKHSKIQVFDISAKECLIAFVKFSINA